jgi:O-antigen biosynthesis protein
MPSPINPVDHPSCLAIPERRAPSAWLEHTPFAMWLTSALRPDTLVELGTQYGTSYCAFCQVIETLGLPTRAFAVDTWEGDPHSGWYTPEVLDDLRRHHDPRYARFSTLLQMTFDDAVAGFADNEIDLLHIDGYHTYEATRHNFETWRPKMSDHGIVLFHDVMVRRDDFGVWKLWEELTSQYRGFTFLHESGLGVLAVGPDAPDEVRALLDLRDVDIASVRTVFHQLGQRLRVANDLEMGLAEREAARKERDVYHAMLDETRVEMDRIRLMLRATEERLASVQQAWDEQLSSQSWRAFHQLMRLGRGFGPEGSRRQLALKRLARLVESLIAKDMGRAPISRPVQELGSPR